jgi:hypothetical protein
MSRVLVLTLNPGGSLCWGLQQLISYLLNCVLFFAPDKSDLLNKKLFSESGREVFRWFLRCGRVFLQVCVCTLFVKE